MIGGGVESLPGKLTLTRDRQIIEHRVGGQVGGSLCSYQCGSKSTCMSWFKSKQREGGESPLAELSTHTHTRLRRRRETELVQWECRLLKLLAGAAA